MENAQTSSKTTKLKLDFKDSKYATGRRKKSIAKVWVKKGTGNIFVNGINMNEYFKRPVHQIILKLLKFHVPLPPLVLLDHHL